MSSNVGKLFVVLGLQASEYEKGLSAASRSAEKQMKIIKKEFSSVEGQFKSAALGVAAFATAFAFSAKKLADAASEAEVNKRRFNIMFGGMAGEAGAWVDNFSKAIGRSNDDVRGWMAGFHQMLVNMGIGEQQAAKMSKRMTELGIDIGSMFGGNDADIMMTIQKALAGQARGLMQYGIILKGITQLDENGNEVLTEKASKMSNVEKAIAMYNGMLKQTANIQGDATRNMETYGNQMKRLQGNVQDLKQEIGERLKPAITETLVEMNRWLTDQQNIDKMNKIGESAAGMTKNIAGAGAWIATHSGVVTTGLEVMFGAWVVNKIVKFASSLGTAWVALDKLARLAGSGMLLNVLRGGVAVWTISAVYEVAKKPDMSKGPLSAQFFGMDKYNKPNYKNPLSGESENLMNQLGLNAPRKNNVVPFSDFSVRSEYLKNYKEPSNKTTEIDKEAYENLIDFKVKRNEWLNGLEMDWQQEEIQRRKQGLNEWAEQEYNQLQNIVAYHKEATENKIDFEVSRNEWLMGLEFDWQQQEIARIEEQKQAWIGFGDTIASTMMYAIQQSGNAWQNIKTGFGNMLESMAAQWLAKAAVFAFLGAISGPLGFAKSMPSFLSFVSGGLFKAAGGPVSSNRPYIVGENGPELFIPGSSGKIIPNNNLTTDNSRWQINYYDTAEDRRKMIGLPDAQYAEQFARCVRDGKIKIKKLA